MKYIYLYLLFAFSALYGCGDTNIDNTSTGGGAEQPMVLQPMVLEAAAEEEAVE